MPHLKLHILFFLFAAALFFSCSNEQKTLVPKAKQGVMDLSNYDFESNDVVKLDGEWEFYWNRLLTTNDFKNDSLSLNPIFLKIPSVWTNTNIDNQKLNADGFATYRLRIKTNKANNLLAIKTKYIGSSYNLFVNGKLLIKCGLVGTSHNTTSPKRLPQECFFATDSTEQEVIIQVSNFRTRASGIYESIAIGTPKQIYDRKKNSLAFDVFIFGVLLVIGLYHLATFVIRREDFASLFFSLVCLSNAFYYSTHFDFILEHIYAVISWEQLVKVDYLNDYIRLPFFVLFIYHLYKEEVSKIFIYIVIAIVSVLALIILVTNAKLFSYTLYFFEVLASISVIYLISAIFRAIMHKREGAIYSLAATAFLLLTMVNDILYANGVIRSFYLTPFGIFIFTFSQSFILSLRISTLFHSQKLLTKRLSTLGKIKDKLIESTSYKLKDPLKIILENIEAERGFILLKNNTKWIVRGYISLIPSENHIPSNTTIDDITDKRQLHLIPIAIINFVLQHRKPITLHNACLNEHFAADEYIKNNQVKSVLCIPLLKKSELVGIVYVENRKDEGIFTDEKVELLDLLTSQILILIDNANIFRELMNLNKNLEEKVDLRTQQVEKQKEILIKQTEKLNNTNRILIDRQEEIEKQSQALKQQADYLQNVNKTFEEQNQMIQRQNFLIKGSINYAQTIQETILPTKDEIDTYFDSFIIYRPKDIVSGDFYWFFDASVNSEIQKKTVSLNAMIDDSNPESEINELIEKNRIDKERIRNLSRKLFNDKDPAQSAPVMQVLFVAVVDCTGHGVPGAFMSLIASRLLDEIICVKKIYNPREILEQLHQGIIKDLRQNQTDNKDGMDICLCKIELINKKDFRLTFSGAKRPLFYCRKDVSAIETLEGVRRSIGGSGTNSLGLDFTNQEIILNTDDTIYLTSDGFADQNNFQRKRFGTNKLIQILQNNADKTIDEQKNIVIRELNNWQQIEEQRDDITIIGLRLK